MRFILFLLLIISLNTFSQTDSRLAEIDNEIKIALGEENFELASILKKEKALRLELNEAVANSDFNLASSHKEKLDDIERYFNIDKLIIQALDKEDYSLAEKLKAEKNVLLTRINQNWKKEEIDVIALEKEEQPVAVEESITPRYDYFGMKPGRKKSYGSMHLTMGYALIDFDDHDFFVSLKWGLKWYSSNTADSKNRFGFQLNHMQVSFYPFSRTLSFAPMNVGFSALTRFSKSAGFEFNFTGGFNAFVDYGDWSIGFRANPELKFRFGFLAVGLDAAYIFSFDVGHVITSGLSIGVTI